MEVAVAACGARIMAASRTKDKTTINFFGFPETRFRQAIRMT